MTDRRYRGKQSRPRTTETGFGRRARMYGEKESRPLPLWNGVFDHHDRIGAALWEFVWCIDKITEEHDGIGLVLGGSPVKLDAIVDGLKGSRRETVRRHLDSLEKENYIRRRRTPYGHVIEVLNSRKFEIWKRPKEKQQNDVSVPPEKPIHGLEKPIGGLEKPKNSINKEDAAVTQHKDAAAAAAVAHSTPKLERENSVWAFLDIQPCGPLPFRAVLEAGWENRNGGPYSILIGDSLDAWKATEGQNPRGCASLFRALSKLREREKANPKPGAVASEEIHVFTSEEIPA